MHYVGTFTVKSVMMRPITPTPPMESASYEVHLEDGSWCEGPVERIREVKLEVRGAANARMLFPGKRVEISLSLQEQAEVPQKL